jgi:hypothetical protein
VNHPQIVSVEEFIRKNQIGRYSLEKLDKLL